MAAVRIIRPPLCGDSASQVPQDQWPELLEERHRFCSENVPHDCRLLLFFVEDAAQSGWLGYPDRETYVRDGLGLDPDLVAWALVGLQKTKPDAAVEFDQMVVLGQREIGIAGGKAGPGRGNKTGTNVTRLPRGNRSTYTLARLKRDNPQLAEQVAEGKLSANKAAIQAGFRLRTVSLPLQPERAAKVLQRHFVGEELQRLIRALQSIQARPKDSKAPSISQSHAGNATAVEVGRS